MPAAPGTERIFLYGTLRRGAAKDAVTHYEGVTFVSSARVRGRLFDFVAYPGLELDAGADWVAGEIFDVTPAALRELDAWEEIDPRKPEDGPYRRIRAVVERADGSTEEAWLYEVAPWHRHGRPLIRSGDWMKPR